MNKYIYLSIKAWIQIRILIFHSVNRLILNVFAIFIASEAFDVIYYKSSLY